MMTQHKTEGSANHRDRMSYWLWFGPLLYMFVVGLYYVGRFGGQWAEVDSSTLTNIIRVFAQEGRLVPGSGSFYPNGYAYQAISTFILALTGVNVTSLQQLIYPVLACIVVLPAWVLYRELTGSARGASLATILLFTQPEFLFVILRSSHEKFTRTLMLLLLFLLVRSFKLRDRPWLFATYIGLFYLTAFAFIASNTLFAYSFIFAIATALIVGWLLERRNPNLRQLNQYILPRLCYITLICLGLAYVFIFYVYPPAYQMLLVASTVGDSVTALALNVKTAATNAYAPVMGTWINTPAYLLLTIANWIILAASFIIWARQGLRWLWQGKAPDSQAAWLLWLLYAAFAAQGALSVIADASNALSSNLQHRLFPSFSTFAVALVGSALVQWRPRRFVRRIQLSLSVGIFCIAVLSALKATNDPIVSNKWTFYRSGELVALQWSDAHMNETVVWTEFDERLAFAFETVTGGSRNGNKFLGAPNPSGARTILLTTITRLRSSRLLYPLPLPPDALRVYDNGEAELYHLRPETPYQP